VLQCGDPTGTGSGGPGYQFGEENLPADGQNNYPAGTVAMANAGTGTNGSQFFLVYEDSELPPEYTVFGQITQGLDVLAGIAAQGTADGSEDGTPKQPVTLDDLVTAA
jgi:peptidyl-prolyl cis-trans isomerase B (cyclophilin B)